MNRKPNVNPERFAELRAESKRLQPDLAAEALAVRQEWKVWVNSLAGIVARHSKEIDEYIRAHCPMTREEVVEKALTKLLSEQS